MIYLKDKYKVSFQSILYLYILVYFLIPQFGLLFGIIPLGHIALLLLLSTFTYKILFLPSSTLKVTKLQKNLFFLVLLFCFIFLFGVVYSNEFSYSLYHTVRILLFTALPFFFIITLRDFNIDKFISLLVFILLVQSMIAFYEELTHSYFYNNFFTYSVPYGHHSYKFGIYRVHSSMGKLAFSIFLATLYPLSFYKNTFMYKLVRVLTPFAVVFTGSIAATVVLFVGLIYIIFTKIKSNKDLIRLLFLITLILFFSFYSGLVDKIIFYIALISDLWSAGDIGAEMKYDINFNSRWQGFIQMFGVIGENIFFPIGYKTFLKSLKEYFDFNTDVGIPFIFAIEIGIWMMGLYIYIFVKTMRIFKLMKNQKLGGLLIISLGSFFILSWTTAPFKLLILPFLLFALAVRVETMKRALSK